MLFGPNRKDRAVMDALGIKAKEWNSLSSEEKKQKYAKAENQAAMSTSTANTTANHTIAGVNLGKYNMGLTDILLEFEVKPGEWRDEERIRQDLELNPGMTWRNAHALGLTKEGKRACYLDADDLGVILKAADLPQIKDEKNTSQQNGTASQQATPHPESVELPPVLASVHPNDRGLVKYVTSTGIFPRERLEIGIEVSGKQPDFLGCRGYLIDQNGNEHPMYSDEEITFLQSLGLPRAQDGAVASVGGLNVNMLGQVAPQQQTGTDAGKKKKVIYDPSVPYDDALQEAIEEKWPNGIPTGDRKKLKKFEDKFENQWKKAKKSFEKREDAEYKPMMKIADAVEKQGEAIEQIIKTLNGPGTP